MSKKLIIKFSKIITGFWGENEKSVKIYDNKILVKIPGDFRKKDGSFKFKIYHYKIIGKKCEKLKSELLHEDNEGWEWELIISNYINY